MFIDEYEDGEYGLRILRGFIVIYAYAFAFIKALVLYRNINKFENNLDLLIMYKNLTDKTSLEIDDVSEKLFPVYNKLYFETFEDKYTIHEFKSFIIIFNKINVSDGCIAVYEEEIQQFKESLGKSAVDFSTNEYHEIISKVHELLYNIDKSKYFITMRLPYDLDYEYIDVVYVMLYEYIIKNIGIFLPCDLFLKLCYDNKVNEVISLKEKHEDESILGVRDRLLSGEFQNDKEQDKLSNVNINRDPKFENYLIDRLEDWNMWLENK